MEIESGLTGAARSRRPPSRRDKLAVEEEVGVRLRLLHVDRLFAAPARLDPRLRRARICSPAGVPASCAFASMKIWPFVRSSNRWARSGYFSATSV